MATYNAAVLDAAREVADARRAAQSLRASRPSRREAGAAAEAWRIARSATRPGWAATSGWPPTTAAAQRAGRRLGARALDTQVRWRALGGGWTRRTGADAAPSAPAVRAGKRALAATAALVATSPTPPAPLRVATERTARPMSPTNKIDPPRAMLRPHRPAQPPPGPG